MPQRKKVLTLGDARDMLPDWVVAGFAQIGIKNPKVVAYEDKENVFKPMILTGKNEDETLSGYIFDPLYVGDPPIHGIESLPSISRVSHHKIISQPSQRLTL